MFKFRGSSEALVEEDRERFVSGNSVFPLLLRLARMYEIHSSLVSLAAFDLSICRAGACQLKQALIHRKTQEVLFVTWIFLQLCVFWKKPLISHEKKNQEVCGLSNHLLKPFDK